MLARFDGDASLQYSVTQAAAGKAADRLDIGLQAIENAARRRLGAGDGDVNFRLGTLRRWVVRVLRLCSVFESIGSGVPAKFDPVGGTQTHTAELTRALDAHGVGQS